MMQRGDISIKTEDDVIEAMRAGATAKELWDAYGERIGGLLAGAIDKLNHINDWPRE